MVSSLKDHTTPGRSSFTNAFTKRPLPRLTESYASVSTQEENDHKLQGDSSATNSTTLQRHLTLTDLVAIGVGGTIGSGLFVLTGLVAHEYAGPATILSWTIAGCAACLSGCCYAELSGRIPATGGAYAYTYVGMGEYPAVLAATCLSMDYISAAGAVARSWGDKVVLWLGEEWGTKHWVYNAVRPRGNVSPMAFLVSMSSVLLLLNGVKESKRVTNFFTTVKVAVSLFMVLVGFWFVKPSNWSPFVPQEFGAAGVMRGATATFFGYLGYDCVCSLGGEAINPKRNLPIAIMITLLGVMVLYISATLALTGMQPYKEISPISGFPEAFYSIDLRFAGQIAAFGELATLPIVVLITVMAQPRLMLAMSDDGLLPAYFRQVDQHGNLWNSTLVSGCVMIAVSTFVPFEKLNDMISFAVLSILNMADSSLILLWHGSAHSRLADKLVLSYHVFALLTAVLCTRFLGSAWGKTAACVTGMITICLPRVLTQRCPRSLAFGGRVGDEADNDSFFQTPFVPYWPFLGVFANWYLIAQLEWEGVVSMIGILGVSTVFYCCLRKAPPDDRGTELIELAPTSQIDDSSSHND